MWSFIAKNIFFKDIINRAINHNFQNDFFQALIIKFQIYLSSTDT
jgi:hypothetical protein